MRKQTKITLVVSAISIFAVSGMTLAFAFNEMIESHVMPPILRGISIISKPWKRQSANSQSTVEKSAEVQSYQKQQHESYQRWGSERTTQELKDEKIWESRHTTTCKTFGQGSEPQLCIEHLGSSSVVIGTPVNYRVRWRNLPHTAFIRVWSRNAAPAGQRWRYMGAQGAIASEPLKGSTEGDVRVKWDGRGVYCAPADGPMMCDAGDVGRYVLRAAIMTGTDPFWPSFPIPNPIPVTYFAQSETAPFTLDGLPQPVTRGDDVDIYRSYPFHSDIEKAINLAAPETRVDWYVRRRIAKLSLWASHWLDYCATLPADEHLTGKIRVCFPKSKRDENGIALSPGDFTAYNYSQLAKGVIASADAVRRASAYALAMLGGQATFLSYPTDRSIDVARDINLTYADINHAYPTFRHDFKESWWIVETSVSINRVIDRQLSKNPDEMVLRVNNDGNVCQVHPTPAQEDEGPNQRQVYTDCLPGSVRHID
jgi:hypothetical protein